MKIGFFQEAPDTFSMTRLLVFMLISYAIIISACVGFVGLHEYYHGKGTLMDVVIAIAALLTSVSTFAAGWKLIQKPMEKSQSDTTNT